MKTILGKLLHQIIPDALVPWVLCGLYALILILVIVLWTRDIDPAGPYLNVFNAHTIAYA